MSAIYENPAILSEYLLFHYGKPGEILPAGVSWPLGMETALGFAQRTPARFTNRNSRRGLDLGCAVGRSTFEMSRTCHEVTGIDFSHAFIAAAEQLKESGKIPYSRRDEGSLETKLEAILPPGIETERVTFLQGDATDLPGNLGTFDRVHAANLLCRLSDPLRLLGSLPSLVTAGGQLVLATPCTWLEEFTPPVNWPGGETLPWLEENLGSHFDLVSHDDEPFLIRETSRKFQWSRSMLTVWDRRGR